MTTGEPSISAVTLARVERAAGALTTRAVALMDERLPWFRTLSAAHRSWVSLVAQAGISGYVEWIGSAGTPAHNDSIARESNRAVGFRLTEAVFGTAPRELVSAVSLRRTVELVRIAISVAEEHFPALAQNEAERAALSDSLLRYSREVAFSAAAIYAAAAETRGRWDQRLEALVVDAIVRGEIDDGLESRAAALSWDTSLPVMVMVGSPPAGSVNPGGAGHRGVAVLTGRHGDRLIVVLAGVNRTDLQRSADDAVGSFADGPVVCGPIGVGLEGAVHSARQALSAIRAAPAWPAAPRGVSAAALLPERALAGDQEAAQTLRHSVFAPLHSAAGAVLQTVEAYLSGGRALETAARELYVHPNTVRYRLHKVTELTGLDPWDPHDAFALQVALALGRIAGSDSAT